MYVFLCLINEGVFIVNLEIILLNLNQLNERVNCGFMQYLCQLVSVQEDRHYVICSRDEFELEFSGSSEPELGPFNFRAETELKIPTICMSKNCKFLLLQSNFPILGLYHDYNQFQGNFYEIMYDNRYLQVHDLIIFIKTFHKKNQIEISARFCPSFHFELNKERTARLGLISNIILQTECNINLIKTD